MLLSCVGYGHALNNVERVNIYLIGTECRYHAWKSLNYWYMDESQKNFIVENYNTKLKDLYIDHDTYETKYIKNFELCAWKL